MFENNQKNHIFFEKNQNVPQQHQVFENYQNVPQQPAVFENNQSMNPYIINLNPKNNAS